jgi:hypothetical protein
LTSHYTTNHPDIKLTTIGVDVDSSAVSSVESYVTPLLETTSLEQVETDCAGTHTHVSLTRDLTIPLATNTIDEWDSVSDGVSDGVIVFDKGSLDYILTSYPVASICVYFANVNKFMECRSAGNEGPHGDAKHCPGGCYYHITTYNSVDLIQPMLSVVFKHVEHHRVLRCDERDRDDDDSWVNVFVCDRFKVVDDTVFQDKVKKIMDDYFTVNNALVGPTFNFPEGQVSIMESYEIMFGEELKKVYCLTEFQDDVSDFFGGIKLGLTEREAREFLRVMQ